MFVALNRMRIVIIPQLADFYRLVFLLLVFPDWFRRLVFFLLFSWIGFVDWFFFSPDFQTGLCDWNLHLLTPYGNIFEKKETCTVHKTK